MTKQFLSTDEFIKRHLRFGQHWNKKSIKLEDAKFQTLENDTYVDGITYAAGSQFKVFETANFGWIVFKADSLTPEGHRPGRFIHKW